jgi:chorismate mutase
MIASELDELRDNLFHLYLKFFSLLDLRRSLVQEINLLKENEGFYKNYSPDREKELFFKLESDLKKLSLKELLSLSLLIEDHAQFDGENSYPSFSAGVHLQNFKGEIHQQINPLILSIYNQELGAKLTLSDKFKKILVGT